MTISRRILLVSGGALAAAAATRAVAADAASPWQTLIDPALSPASLRLAVTAARTETRALRPDLVREWRDGLGVEITRAHGAIAYVRWDKALLLAGLARESGLRAQRQRLGPSLFRVAIGHAA